MKLGPYELGPNDTPEQAIYEGDSEQLARAIPDESVRLILCDPVYNMPEQYRLVAEIAARVLRDGGNLIAQSGHIYRFENECAAASVEGLDHRPLLTEVFTGGFGTLWKHRALRSSTPYLWFSKGDIRGRGFPRTAFFGSKDKSRHKWADGTRSFIYLIETLTKEGDIVLDPFAGSATVAAACIMTGRRYLAFEIVHDTCLMARQRVRETQPPLLQVPPQQLVLMKGNNNHAD